MEMFTPVFRNRAYDIEFVFPKLHVPNKEYAMEVGKIVAQSAMRENFVDVEFTETVADLNELAKDTENLRILSPFDIETGEKEHILILTPAGEVPDSMKE